jgi:V/A-type H+/Na+-transporting ATPase subunit I
VLDPLYHTLFGLEEKPISVMEPETTNMIIFSSVGLGIALVITAILINIYSSLRRKRYTSAFFGPNGVAGLIFYLAIVLGFWWAVYVQFKRCKCSLCYMFYRSPLNLDVFPRYSGRIGRS